MCGRTEIPTVREEGLLGALGVWVGMVWTHHVLAHMVADRESAGTGRDSLEPCRCRSRIMS